MNETIVRYEDGKYTAVGLRLNPVNPFDVVISVTLASNGFVAHISIEEAKALRDLLVEFFNEQRNG